MAIEDRNPRITRFLFLLSAVECVVLIAAGGGLFFLSDIAQTQWPWPDIRLYATRVVGAAYLSSLVAVAAMLFYGRWSPARLVLPMIFTFTTIVLIVSLLYRNVFDFSRWATWGWFLLYILLPLSSAYHLWLYRRLSPADPIRLPQAWKIYLFAQGLVAAIFGAGLLLLPETFNELWPGRFDNFHGQLYSAIFITAAVGSWIVARAASRAEWITLALTQGTLAFFMLLGVLVVNASMPEGYQLEWTPGALIWLIYFGAMLITGMLMLWQALIRRGVLKSIGPSLHTQSG